MKVTSSALNVNKKSSENYETAVLEVCDGNYQMLWSGKGQQWGIINVCFYCGQS